MSTPISYIIAVYDFDGVERGYVRCLTGVNILTTMAREQAYHWPSHADAQDVRDELAQRYPANDWYVI